MINRVIDNLFAYLKPSRHNLQTSQARSNIVPQGAAQQFSAANDDLRRRVPDYYSVNAAASLDDARGNFIAADASLKMRPDNTARENDLETAAMALWVAATVVMRDPVSLQLAMSKGLDPSALLKRATLAREGVEHDRELQREAKVIRAEGFGDRFVDGDGIERQVVVGKDPSGSYHFAVSPTAGKTEHEWNGPYDSKRDAYEHGDMARRGIAESELVTDNQIELGL